MGLRRKRIYPALKKVPEFAGFSVNFLSKTQPSCHFRIKKTKLEAGECAWDFIPCPVVPRVLWDGEGLEGFPLDPLCALVLFQHPKIGALIPEPLPHSVPARPGLGTAPAAEIPFSPFFSQGCFVGWRRPLRPSAAAAGSMRLCRRWQRQCWEYWECWSTGKRDTACPERPGVRTVGSSVKNHLNPCISGGKWGIFTQAGVFFFSLSGLWGSRFPPSVSRCFV